MVLHDDIKTESEQILESLKFPSAQMSAGNTTHTMRGKGRPTLEQIRLWRSAMNSFVYELLKLYCPRFGAEPSERSNVLAGAMQTTIAGTTVAGGGGTVQTTSPIVAVVTTTVHH